MKYSPTIREVYPSDEEWFLQFMQPDSNQYDDDGYDQYGYDENDLDRNGHDDFYYQWLDSQEDKVDPEEF